MACNDDLAFGHGRDEQLLDMYAALVGFNPEKSGHMVAGVLWLDQAAGLAQEGDYVLMNRSLAIWLLQEVTIRDDAISAALQGKDVAAFERLMTEQPFDIEFTSPLGPVSTADFPENVRGKKIQMRVMTEREAGQLSFVYTVRSGGEFIRLPFSPQSLSDLDD